MYFQGDSGGPLVCEDGKAYGVVSHTYKANDGQLFYSYAKIPDHKPWIYQTIKNAWKKLLDWSNPIIWVSLYFSSLV